MRKSDSGDSDPDVVRLAIALRVDVNRQLTPTTHLWTTVYRLCRAIVSPGSFRRGHGGIFGWGTSEPWDQSTLGPP